jgi:hypothetical protein
MCPNDHSVAQAFGHVPAQGAKPSVSASPSDGASGASTPTALPTVLESARAHELETIRDKSARATRLILAAGTAIAAPLAALDLYLALVPAAFILGWLNLVGL